jgi:hypothetical protein
MISKKSKAEAHAGLVNVRVGSLKIAQPDEGLKQWVKLHFDVGTG